MPINFGRYFEPFVGGGALFFDLNREQSYISDVNPELINTYQMVGGDVNALIDLLQDHSLSSCKEYYFQIRAMDRDPNFRDMSNLERAARFIYLNKTCFNGVHRVNSKGFNNVPYSGNEFVVDFRALREAHELLRKTTIETASFTKVVDIAKENDFVYFDPPYVPVSATSNFTSYERDGFTYEDQEKLVEVMNQLTANNVHVMVSNSWCDKTQELYAGFNKNQIFASRMVNANGKGRGKVSEMLAISNYATPLTIITH